MSAGDVIYFDSAASASLFEGAESKAHFWSICRYFVSEKFLTYCGIAAGVTVLNSLAVDSPGEPQIYPYKLFTQDNIFTDAVLRRRRPVQVEKTGNTLEQLASIIAVFDVQVDISFGETLDIDGCRSMLVDSLADRDRRIILDFDRRALHQKGNGHFSPIAAYNSHEDRFLIMDVARYKYPPYWITTELLHRAIVATDPVSTKSRGFLTVSRQSDFS